MGRSGSFHHRLVRCYSLGCFALIVNRRCLLLALKVARKFGLPGMGQHDGMVSNDWEIPPPRCVRRDDEMSAFEAPSLRRLIWENCIAWS